jgi:mono/diheme cytochrome c family protein
MINTQGLGLTTAAIMLGLFIVAQAASTESLLAKGRQIVEDNCSRCHAIGRAGPSKHPLAPPFRVVVSRYDPAQLSEALAEGIVSGHPDMPVFTFRPDEIGAIVAYLKSLSPQKR